MDIRQSGESNTQHVGDVIHNYYFGAKKTPGKLPLKVLRIDTVLSNIITLAPIYLYLIFSLYYILNYKTIGIGSGNELAYIVLSVPILSGLIWYMLPMFMPSLLITLFQDMIIIDGEKIMFRDVYKIKRDAKVIVLYLRDGDVLKLKLSKLEHAEDIYDYYSLAVRAG